MNRTLIALWTIIAGAIVSIAALVVVYNHQRETDARLELDALLRQQLDPYRREIAEVFEDYQRDLASRLAGFNPLVPSAIADLQRGPLVGQVIIVSDEGARGQLIYPRLEYVELAERSLVVDAINWLRDSNLSGRTPSTNNSALPNAPFTGRRHFATPQPMAEAPSQVPVPQSVQSASISDQSAYQLPPSRSYGQQAQRGGYDTTSALSASRADANGINFNSLSQPETHWTTWYHGRGMVLGYWVESPGNTLTMIIVPRGRWLADVIGKLPDNSQAGEAGLIQLVDVEGTVMTQWGDLSLTDSQPQTEMPIDDPLEGWRLRLSLSPEAYSSALRNDARWLSGLGAIGASTTLILLGMLITLNLNRQLRQAAQQVSFVNQVSHELRTPLTNIRMYTDLARESLEKQAPESSEADVQRLEIIQHESARLGRLIENVLSFARQGHANRPMRTTHVEDVDLLVDSILQTFEPQLDELQVKLERTRGASTAVQMDREVFEQILVNLVSNSLKYAASGKYIHVSTALDGQRLTVQVIDTGPGIPKRQHKRVFQPFVRLRSRLEDPAGTGIGLTIAKQLARQHGGDCTLQANQPSGCCFAFTVKVIPSGR